MHYFLTNLTIFNLSDNVFLLYKKKIKRNIFLIKTNETNYVANECTNPLVILVKTGTGSESDILDSLVSTSATFCLAHYITSLQ